MQQDLERRELTDEIPQFFCQFGLTVTMDEDAATMLKIHVQRPPLDASYYCICPNDTDQDQFTGSNCLPLKSISPIDFSVGHYGKYPWSQKRILSELADRYHTVRSRGSILVRSSAFGKLRNDYDDDGDKSFKRFEAKLNHVDRFFLKLARQNGPFLLNREVVILSKLLAFNQQVFLGSKETVKESSSSSSSWFNQDASVDEVNKRRLLFVLSLCGTTIRGGNDDESDSDDSNSSAIRDDDEKQGQRTRVKWLKQLISKIHDDDSSLSPPSQQQQSKHYIVIVVNRDLSQTTTWDEINELTNENVALVPLNGSMSCSRIDHSYGRVEQYEPSIDETFMEMIGVMYAYQHMGWRDWSFMTHLNIDNRHDVVAPVSELESYLISRTVSEEHLFYRVSASLFAEEENPTQVCYEDGCVVLDVPVNSQEEAPIMTKVSPFHIISNQFYRIMLSSQASINVLITEQRRRVPNYLSQLVKTLSDETTITTVHNTRVTIPVISVTSDFNDSAWFTVGSNDKR